MNELKSSPADAGSEPFAASSYNVVLILTDDMGWGDLGIHGNELIETPHLDALAGASVRFNSFCVHPCCAPTRASLFTGRHYLRTGVTHVHGGGDFLHQEEVLISQWFKANGYATGMWGKWHSGKTAGYFPWERGFDEAYMADLYRHYDAGGLMNGQRISTPGWTTDAITDMALNFIERHKGRPFFAFLPHLAPHAPLLARQELVEKYVGKGLGKEMATAFAMVEMVDDSVGRIIGKLDQLGIAENTIVIFLSDNGPQFFGYRNCSPEDYSKRNPANFKGHKGSMWENGVRVPFFVRLPGRLPPCQVDRLADVHDVLPTLIDLCDLKHQPEGVWPIDGRSIVPYLEGRDDLPPKSMVIASNLGWPPIKAEADIPFISENEYAPVPQEDIPHLAFDSRLLSLRMEDYKLLRNPGYAEDVPASFGGEVLVKIKADPTETRNWAALEPEIAATMREQLNRWFEEIKNEQHAFQPPCFRVDPDAASKVYLYAMRRRLGQAINFALDTRAWEKPGDGGEYLITVQKSGTYRVGIEADGISGIFPVELKVNGTLLLQSVVSAQNAMLGNVQLPEGRSMLSVVRGSGHSDASVDRIVALEFIPQ